MIKHYFSCYLFYSKKKKKSFLVIFYLYKSCPDLNFYVKNWLKINIFNMLCAVHGPDFVLHRFVGVYLMFFFLLNFFIILILTLKMVSGLILMTFSN